MLEGLAFIEERRVIDIGSLGDGMHVLQSPKDISIGGAECVRILILIGICRTIIRVSLQTRNEKSHQRTANKALREDAGWTDKGLFDCGEFRFSRGILFEERLRIINKQI
jgi:hypothetical protein